MGHEWLNADFSVSLSRLLISLAKNLMIVRFNAKPKILSEFLIRRPTAAGPPHCRSVTSISLCGVRNGIQSLVQKEHGHQLRQSFFHLWIQGNFLIIVGMQFDPRMCRFMSQYTGRQIPGKTQQAHDGKNGRLAAVVVGGVGGFVLIIIFESLGITVQGFKTTTAPIEFHGWHFETMTMISIGQAKALRHDLR